MKPQAAAPQKPQVVKPPSRMKLGGVIKGRLVRPVRVVIHGVDGVGKSTFGADAPSPIFLGAEDGTAQLDVARFPAPQSWDDMLDAVRELATEPHEFKTLVVDSLDWAEPLVWRHLCEASGKTSIEDVGGGFGKGYTAAVDEWRRFLAAMEPLRSLGMNVVLIAHSTIKSFKNPEGDDYERYQLKLHEKSASTLREWADDVLFATHEVVVAKNEKTKRVRGVDTGARIMHSVRSAAFDAKNRHSLPAVLPLSWAEYWSAVQAGQVAEPAALRAAVEALLPTLGEKDRAALPGHLLAAGDDAVKLAKLLDWTKARGAKEET